MVIYNILCKRKDTIEATSYGSYLCYMMWCAFPLLLVTITLHALLFIFLAVIPIMIGGYGNLILPMSLGSMDIHTRQCGVELLFLEPWSMLYVMDILSWELYILVPSLYDDRRWYTVLVPCLLPPNLPPWLYLTSCYLLLGYLTLSEWWLLGCVQSWQSVSYVSGMGYVVLSAIDGRLLVLRIVSGKGYRRLWMR